MIPGRKCGGSGLRHGARSEGARGEVEKRKRGDVDEFWEDLGVDIEGMSPQAQAAIGAVTGGVVLLAAALVLLFTELWWLIFVFGWLLFPALGIFARGVAGLMDSPQRLPADEREQELLEALRSGGELSPAQVAMETSLTVLETDEMLGRLAGEGHLRLRVSGGGLFYSLWEIEPGDSEDHEITGV